VSTIVGYFRAPSVGDDAPYHLDHEKGVAFRLRRYYQPLQSGINVILYTDGSVSPHYVAGQPTPYPIQKWDPLFGSGDTQVNNLVTYVEGVATPTITGDNKPVIQRILYGGHAEPVNATEQAALVAAGFGPFITSS
jgi:hypothetical protein